MRSLVFLLFGLLMLGGCKPQLAQGVERAKSTATTKATERSVSFVGAGGVRLEGTLMIPAGAMDRRYPAVLLIAGSGPTDRDGNQPGLKTDTLKQIAFGLADAEIASFRFDKRAVAANAPQWPKKPVEIGEFFSWDHFVDDALAAYEAMQRSEFVDSGHCALLGHSEGGTIALAMAAQARPVTLVLVSTPGRTYDQVIRSQLVRSLGTAGPSGQKLLAENDRITAAIRATGRVPDNVPKELAALYNPSVGVFFQQSYAAVPTDLARAFQGPVLVMNGESDIQVDPKIDAEALFEACKSRKESKLSIVPLTSHNLKMVTGPSDPGFEGLIVPDAIETIQLYLIPIIGGKEPVGDSNLH